jgi:ribosomal protein S12 methylthiotransferase accessory factor
MRQTICMQFESRRKIAHGRCVLPEETIARLEALIRPRHAYWLHEETVGPKLHWTALFLEDEPEFRAMGKGVTPEFSRAGALAEAAEWLTVREVDQLPGYVAAHQDEVENALRIEDLLPHIATATPPVLERIKALDDAKHWVDGWSLRRDETVKVPLEYVRLIGGPNGKATGNYIEEAIEHAVNEVFERRAHVTVLRNRMVLPTIDIETVENPVIRGHIEFIQSQGIEVILKDRSFDGVLPCVGAYFRDPAVPDDYQFHHFFKVGASFNHEEALLRCFTEFTQGRREDEFIDGSPEALERLLEADFRQLRTEDNSCDNFLSAFMFGLLPYRDAGFLREGEVVALEADPGHEDCLEDIRHAVGICEMLDKDLIVVDLTDPEVGFPVVQVVVPGYSDVLPFQPGDSPGMFERWTRTEVLEAYEGGG